MTKLLRTHIEPRPRTRAHKTFVLRFTCSVRTTNQGSKAIDQSYKTVMPEYVYTAAVTIPGFMQWPSVAPWNLVQKYGDGVHWNMNRKKKAKL